MSTLVDLLRHGEPVGGHAYRGNGVDDPLSETGWTQMRTAVGGYRDWDRIITSPMRRCRDFAEYLGGRISLPVVVEPDLREIGFGQWEGRTREQVIAADPDGYAAFYRDPVHFTPPGAEPLPQFAERVIGAYRSILNDFSEQRLLVVAHAGVIRAVLVHVLGASADAAYRIQVEYAGLSRVRGDGSRAWLEFHNRQSLF